MSQRKYSNTIWYVGWLRSRKPDKEEKWVICVKI